MHARIAAMTLSGKKTATEYLTCTVILSYGGAHAPITLLPHAGPIPPPQLRAAPAGDPSPRHGHHARRLHGRPRHDDGERGPAHPGPRLQRLGDHDPVGDDRIPAGPGHDDPAHGLGDRALR